MTQISEFAREYSPARVARRINGLNLVETMANEMLVWAIHKQLGSDNGVERSAEIVRGWLAKTGAKHALYLVRLFSNRSNRSIVRRTSTIGKTAIANVSIAAAG